MTGPSESPAPGVVKSYGEIVTDNSHPEDPGFPGQIPDTANEQIFRRVAGYLRGWFVNGVPCILAAELKRRYQRRTGYSWRHVDDIFPAFQKWTTEFVFQKQRLGRSTCIVITQRHRPLKLTTAEVRRRLVGAIRNHVAKGGSCHVDRKFLENFHSLCGLPPEQIFAAWASIYRIEGLVCRWKGRGNGKNLYVQTPTQAGASTAKRQQGGRKFAAAGQSHGEISHPENASGISPLRGKRSENRDGQAVQIPEETSGSLREQPGGFAGEGETGVARPGTEKTLRGRADGPRTPPGGDDQSQSGRPHPRQSGFRPAMTDRASHPWKPARRPLQFCNRSISAARINRKAAWMAHNPMQTAHTEFFYVRFLPGYVFKFCVESLSAGFRDCDICAAYRAGLKISHGSASAERYAAGIMHPWAPRVPSQAVSEAWKILRADLRSDSERWADIFAGGPAPAPAAAKCETSSSGEGPAVTPCAGAAAAGPIAGTGEGSSSKNRPEKIRTGSQYVKIGYGMRVRMDDPPLGTASPGVARKGPIKSIVFGKEGSEMQYREGPDLTPALKKAALKNPQTIEDHMVARGLDISALLKLSRAEQQKFVRDALAAQKQAGESSKKGDLANE